MASMSACQQRLGDQPKYDAYEESHFYENGSANRAPVKNTVARGSVQADALFDTGMVNGKESDHLPMPMTSALLKRGQQRFGIYCSACHGLTGEANGVVVQRGFPAPPSYHEERLRQAPIGHFFNVMTNGYGRMYRFGDRIPAADRWAISAYIRALQLSRNVNVRDLTADERARLEK